MTHRTDTTDRLYIENVVHRQTDRAQIRRYTDRETAPKYPIERPNVTESPLKKGKEARTGEQMHGRRSRSVVTQDR